MRKIVFAGNCQGRRLQELYRDEFAYLSDDTTDFVVTYANIGEEARVTLREADIVVAQVLDADQSAALGLDEISAKIILYPNVTGVFLWPFSGVPHPCEQALPDFWHGAFGAQFGDRWLNRQLAAGIPAADIVAEYLDLDIAKAGRLDRLFELHMDRARQRDARTGFAIAPEIERRLPLEALFINPSNLEMPLFRHLAIGVYEQLGVPPAETERVLDGLWRSPFPTQYAPVHPGVARHFGMTHIGPESRFAVWTGERVTFAEWADRYVRGDWNNRMLEAVFRAGRIKHYGAEAVSVQEELQTELAATGGSDLGYASLAHLLSLKGDRDAALETTLTAVAFDRSSPNPHLNIAYYLMMLGDLDGAEARIREVIRTWPNFAHGWNRLAWLLEVRGDRPGAVAAVEKAVALAPRDIELLGRLADIAGRLGFGDPLRGYHAALRRDPNNIAVLTALTKAEADRGQVPEALTFLARALARSPDDPALLKRQAELLALSGDIAGAEAAYARSVAKEPDNAEVHEFRANLLITLGRYNDAVESVRRAAELEQRSALPAKFAAHLARLEQFGLAAELYRDAIQRNWTDLEAILGLANALTAQGDTVGAVMAFHRAIQIAPGDPYWHIRLADLLMARCAFEAAKDVLDTAAQHLPVNAEIQNARALLCIHMGDLPAALAAADKAVTLDPANSHIAARRAHILSEMGDYAAAEQAYAAAMAMAPDFADYHAMLGLSFLRRNRACDALFAYREAAKLDPANAAYRDQVAALSAAVGSHAAEPASRAALAVQAPQTGGTPLDLMDKFYTVGSDCEFGVFQELFEHTSLNLLNKADTPVDAVIDMLINGFSTLLNPASLRPVPAIGGGDNYMMHNDTYRMQWHAHGPTGGRDIAIAIQHEARLMKRLAELWLEEISNGTRILVRKAGDNENMEDDHRLYQALTLHCRKPRLLCVHSTEKPGHPFWDGPLLRGHIGWFPDIPSPDNIDRAGWLTLCQFAAAAEWPI